MTCGVTCNIVGAFVGGGEGGSLSYSSSKISLCRTKRKVSCEGDSFLDVSREVHWSRHSHAVIEHEERSSMTKWKVAWSGPDVATAISSRRSIG